MAQLAENRYGKSSVRLVRVNRQAPIHEFEEWSVDVLLRGEYGQQVVRLEDEPDRARSPIGEL